jgi:hypothetical protein
MDILLTKDQANCIYTVSYLSVIPFLYAVYRDHLTLAIVPGSVFLSSIHYWKKPDYSYRRYLDMGVVKTALVYQTYMAYSAEYANIYYSFMFLGIVSYVAGIQYYKKREYWKSTYSHMMLHVLANLGNMALYSGYV